MLHNVDAHTLPISCRPIICTVVSQQHPVELSCHLQSVMRSKQVQLATCNGQKCKCKTQCSMGQCQGVVQIRASHQTTADNLLGHTHCSLLHKTRWLSLSGLATNSARLATAFTLPTPVSQGYIRTLVKNRPASQLLLYHLYVCKSLRKTSRARACLPLSRHGTPNHYCNAASSICLNVCGSWLRASACLLVPASLSRSHAA